MIEIGPDGRMVLVSAAEPRFALHTVTLDDGTRLKVKEDLWQTPAYRAMDAALIREPVIPGPQFYVTEAYQPDGQKADLSKTKLPDQFHLSDGTIVKEYVLPQ